MLFIFSSQKIILQVLWVKICTFDYIFIKKKQHFTTQVLFKFCTLETMPQTVCYQTPVLWVKICTFDYIFIKKKQHFTTQVVFKFCTLETMPQTVCYQTPVQCERSLNLSVGFTANTLQNI